MSSAATCVRSTSVNASKSHRNTRPAASAHVLSLFVLKLLRRSGLLRIYEVSFRGFCSHRPFLGIPAASHRASANAPQRHRSTAHRPRGTGPRLRPRAQTSVTGQIRRSHRCSHRPAQPDSCAQRPRLRTWCRLLQEGRLSQRRPQPASRAKGRTQRWQNHPTHRAHALSCRQTCRRHPLSRKSSELVSAREYRRCLYPGRRLRTNQKILRGTRCLRKNVWCATGFGHRVSVRRSHAASSRFWPDRGGIRP